MTDTVQDVLITVNAITLLITNLTIFLMRKRHEP